MALGKNVEHLRSIRGMSRGTVARALGLEDDQPIYALEKRDSRRSNLAPGLAKFFNVALEDLLERDLTAVSLEELGRPKESAVTSPSANDALQERLLRAYQSLNPQGQAELVRYAEYLLKAAE